MYKQEKFDINKFIKRVDPNETNARLKGKDYRVMGYDLSEPLKTVYLHSTERFGGGMLMLLDDFLERVKGKEIDLILETTALMNEDDKKLKEL